MAVGRNDGASPPPLPSEGVETPDVAEGRTQGQGPFSTGASSSALTLATPRPLRVTAPGTQRHPFTNLLDQYSRALRATEDRLDALLGRFDDLQRLYRLKCAESSGREAAVGALKLELAQARQDVSAAVVAQASAEERCEVSEEAGRRLRASLEEAERKLLVRDQQRPRRTVWRHDKGSQCDDDNDSVTRRIPVRRKVGGGGSTASDVGTQDYPSPALAELMAQLEEERQSATREGWWRRPSKAVEEEAVPATAEAGSSSAVAPTPGVAVEGREGDLYPQGAPSLAPGSDRGSHTLEVVDRGVLVGGASGEVPPMMNATTRSTSERQAALDDCNTSLKGLLREIASCREYVENSRNESPSRRRGGVLPAVAPVDQPGTAPPTLSPLTPVDLYAAKLNSLERDLLEFYDSTIKSQSIPGRGHPTSTPPPPPTRREQSPPPAP